MGSSSISSQHAARLSDAKYYHPAPAGHGTNPLSAFRHPVHWVFRTVDRVHLQAAW